MWIRTSLSGCLGLTSLVLLSLTCFAELLGLFSLPSIIVLLYARADYRIGENLEGWSVNAGLRYQFAAGPSRSIKDDPRPIVYAYNWTGLRGVHLGSCRRGDLGGSLSIQRAIGRAGLRGCHVLDCSAIEA